MAKEQDRDDDADALWRLPGAAPSRLPLARALTDLLFCLWCCLLQLAPLRQRDGAQQQKNTEMIEAKIEGY